MTKDTKSFKSIQLNEILWKEWDTIISESLTYALVLTFRGPSHFKHKFHPQSYKKAVAMEKNDFIHKEGLSNVNQSSYQNYLSTETALLKIQNDNAVAVSHDKAVGLTDL